MDNELHEFCPLFLLCFYNANIQLFFDMEKKNEKYLHFFLQVPSTWGRPVAIRLAIPCHPIADTEAEQGVPKVGGEAKAGRRHDEGRRADGRGRHGSVEGKKRGCRPVGGTLLSTHIIIYDILFNIGHQADWQTEITWSPIHTKCIGVACSNATTSGCTDTIGSC